MKEGASLLGVLRIPEKPSVVFTKQSISNYPVRMHNAYTRHTIHEITNPVVSSIANTSKKRRRFGQGNIISKGQKMPVPCAKPIICAGWDVKNPQCDVDISAFLIDTNNKIIGDEWFVFYGQTDSPDNSVHLDCNGTQNDDKIIHIDTTKIDGRVKKIVFVLTIDEAETKRLNFSMLCNAYIRILDNDTELFRFLLNDYYESVTSMMLGELYLHNNQWKFNAIGNGVKRDLAGLCEMYGVQTE